MKFDKKSIVSLALTLFILGLITIIVKLAIDEWKRSKQEGLQYYGDERDSLQAPLPYKTIMENIKYPDTNSPIYDIENEIHNSNLFNRSDKSMHFSDEQIMKDLKHFNNASNLLLEHYLNNNVPETTTINIQDLSGTNPVSSKLSIEDLSGINHYDNIQFKTFIDDNAVTPPSYLQNNSNNITIEKTYMYRRPSGSDDFDPNGTTPPSNGMYMLKQISKVNNAEEKDNIYNYNYDLSGLYYTDIYNELTKYEDSSFNNTIPMTKPGKYSSYFFESNYSDLSDNVTTDFKHFYSTSNTLAGRNLFNKS
jgi:hypothetical protein